MNNVKIIKNFKRLVAFRTTTHFFLFSCYMFFSILMLYRAIDARDGDAGMHFVMGLVAAFVFFNGFFGHKETLSFDYEVAEVSNKKEVLELVHPDFRDKVLYANNTSGELVLVILNINPSKLLNLFTAILSPTRYVKLNTAKKEVS